MTVKNVEKLCEIIQEIIATGAQISDVRYIGLGVYQGVSGREYKITESQMVDICSLLNMTKPSGRLWDSEVGFIHCQPGSHAHSLHHK